MSTRPHFMGTFFILSLCTNCIDAAEFHRNDSVLLLVKGPAAQSTPWGMSGQCSMYVANRTTTSGKLGFSPVPGATEVACERRSACKVDQPFDYKSKGQIPPGVYFVSYHRLDSNRNRHRLAIGDAKGGTTIKYGNVTRTYIQFHEAINDLQNYRPGLSEGCLIFSKANFRKLFPAEFLDSDDSPLAPSTSDLPSAKKYRGQERLLVFVTDITDADKQQRQIKLFENLIKGNSDGLTTTDFATNSAKLRSIRTRWAN